MLDGGKISSRDDVSEVPRDLYVLDADDSKGHLATCVELLPRTVGGRAGEKLNVENHGDCKGHDQAGQRRLDCHLRRFQ